MKRLILLILLLLSIAFAPQVVHHAYLPSISANRTDGLGLEWAGVWGNLTAIRPVYLRSNFGSQIDPYDSLYQHYVVGGWAEVDAQLAVLEDWRDIGAQPIVIFMRGGLPCKVPTLAQLATYGNFIVAAVARYDLDIFEVTNEPENPGGYPSLFGCWGKQYADRLIYLLDYVQARVPDTRQVGVSFQAGSATQFVMLTTAASHADWIGVHFYSVYGGGVVQYPWPGGLTQLVTMAEQYHDDVRVTEFNLRSPGNECGLAHQQAQTDEIADALDLDLPMLSILVYYNYPDWQCSGIKNTLTEEMLMPGGGYP